MELFESKTFTMHSGDIGHWKIECDALTNADIETLALMIAEKFDFSVVYGIPTGGTRIQKALEKYKNSKSTKVLIVDDVLTTGMSMSEARNEFSQSKPASDIVGVVLFSRGQAPDWIYPVFQLWNK